MAIDIPLCAAPTHFRLSRFWFLITGGKSELIRMELVDEKQTNKLSKTNRANLPARP